MIGMNNTYRVITLERLEVVESVDRRGVPDPLQSLPVSDDPDVVHSVD